MPLGVSVIEDDRRYQAGRRLEQSAIREQVH
jgi:hypothetical protein